MHMKNSHNAHTPYPRKFRFGRMSVSRIIINPKAARYPEVFLLCRRPSVREPFLMGLGLYQLNWLLMNVFDKVHGLDIAARIGDIYARSDSWGEISLRQHGPDGLVLSDLQMDTRLGQFELKDTDGTEPLYYFELLEMEKFTKK